MDAQDLLIVITSDWVSIAGVRFSSPPAAAELRSLLPAGPVREHRRGGAYLPALVFDDLGLVARFQSESGIVALVDVHFATSGKEEQPLRPFVGRLVLNGQELRRPILFKRVKSYGEFTFDGAPVPTAGTQRIGVSLTPKFEYLGIVNFGWHTD